MSKKKPDDEDRPSPPRPRLPWPDPVRDRPMHPVDPSKVEVGDVMRAIIDRTRCVYGRVKEVSNGGSRVVLENLLEPDRGDEVIDGWDKVVAMRSADYVAETVKASRTTMSGILLEVVDKPVTVSWIKKDGQERVLWGYNTSERVNRFGRVLCVDLKPTSEDLAILAEKHRTLAENFKEVDHRTIMFLVVGGVRYELC